MLDENVIRFDFFFFLCGCESILILPDGVLNKLLKLLVFGEFEVPFTLYHVGNALVFGIRQDVLDVRVDDLEGEGEVVAVRGCHSIIAFSMGYLWYR